MNETDSTLVRTAPAPGLDAAALTRRGFDRSRRGDLTGALADFRQAILIEPGCAVAWNNCGLLRHAQGDPAAALTDFDRALVARPDFAEALVNRGLALQALGRCDEAMADFDRALCCTSEDSRANALHNRGTLKQARGDWHGARADFDAALATDPGHHPTFVNRAAVRKALGDLAGALADLDGAQVLTAPERAGPIHHLRGGVKVLQSDFRGAIAEYDRALALEPANVVYLLSRATARYHFRDPRGVIDYRTAFRLNPRQAAQEMLRVLVESVRPDPEAALTNCNKHLRISGHDALAYARRGWTLVLLGREAEAEADLTLFGELLPDLKGYLDSVTELIRRRSQADGQAPSCHLCSSSGGAR
jgi:tetratricopeptide (TPR) repeat protein